MSYGIDYGGGTTNIDRETGIRFGVIPQNDVLQAWAESSEPDYGPPGCSECGSEAVGIGEVPFDLDDLKTLRQSDGYCRKHAILQIPDEHQADCGDNDEWHDEGRDYACLNCARSFYSEDAWGDDPVGGYVLDDGEYKAHCGEDGDIFILKSPYYTHAQFCSPCAPGACYLQNPVDDSGPKAYCFGPDFFDDEYPCPYPVYRVDEERCIYQPVVPGDTK